MVQFLRQLCICLALVALPVIGMANSAKVNPTSDWSYRLGLKKDVLVFDGDVLPGLHRDMKQAFETGRVKTLILNSPGGQIDEVFWMYHLIAKYKPEVVIGPDGCWSACAFMALGASDKVSGTLHFHGPSVLGATSSMTGLFMHHFRESARRKLKKAGLKDAQIDLALGSEWYPVHFDDGLKLAGVISSTNP